MIVCIYIKYIHVTSAWFLILFQGISYDHIELNFYLNGKPLDAPCMGIKGTTFPVLYGNNILVINQSLI